MPGCFRFGVRSRGALSGFGGALLQLALAQAQPNQPQANDGGSAPDSEPAPVATDVEPPRVQSQVTATYPDSALAARVEGTVVLLVTIAESGLVSETEVKESVTPELDAAAADAVTQWVFVPATRDGKPVAARILVSVPFVLPEPNEGLARVEDTVTPRESTSANAQATSVPSSASPSAPVRRVAAADADPPPTTEVTVAGERNPDGQPRSSSDFFLKHDVLDAAPHHEGVDVLLATPGLYIARPEGAAVAHRYMLRGFDSEHGQDIEFRVGGVPINLPSHIHGQGYADLGLLVGDAVSELRVTEGVHDPRQGDFAVAGSIDVRLGVTERGVKLRSGYGSFGTFQQLVMWAPPDALPDTFGAVEVQTTDGFGQNRAGEKSNVVLQQGFTWLDWRVRLLGMFHGARARMAGALRRDDVESGQVGFYDVYPWPAARAQNAMNVRGIFGFFGDYQGLLGDSAEVGVWTSLDRFRVQQNWTGFLERSQTLPNVAGRGDLIEQRNHTDSIGLNARYRTVGKELGPIHAHLALGASARLDTIEQQQNLLDASVNNQTWDQRVDAQIAATDLGTWFDLDLHWDEWSKLRLGYRADLLGYEVEDRLGNRAAATRPDGSYIVGYRRSAMGLAHGPRLSADFEPWSFLTLHASYGQGYRSPQARMLTDGEPTPFSKVHSADVGLRWQVVDETELTVSAYHTELSSDVAFDATEGRLERVGATVRRGAVVHLETRPVTGIVGAFSVTYVDAELVEPPPATAEEPNPPFARGQNLPFVPPLVARADVGVQRDLGQWLETPLRGKLGIGVSALSSRPLPYGYFGQAFGLLDASAGVGFGAANVVFSAYNLLDAEYPASEYSFVSSWDPTEPSSRVPARHVVAGAPRTLMLSLEISL